VQTRDTEYYSDGTKTTTGVDYRIDGTIHQVVSRDVNGVKTYIKYEADGQTIKLTVIKTPESEGVNETRIYKDADGDVYRATTTIAEEGIDKDGNPVTIYSEIDDATGLAHMHNDNGNENYWGVVHQTHQHKWYMENGEKVFITEELDEDGNVVNTVYSNNFGYVDTVPTPQPIDSPVTFSAATITAKQASEENYNGADYSANPGESIIKLTMHADMANVTDTSVFSIAGAEIDLSLDWTQFEAIDYGTNGTAQAFETKNAIDTQSVFQAYTDDITGAINKIVVGSIDTAANPPKTLVDNVDSSGMGVADRPSSLELGSIYLNPIDSADTVDLSYGGIVVTNEASDHYTQLHLNIDLT